MTEIVSHEPATGAELWRGPVGNVDETVAVARRAWPQWAARPLANRIELLRRFVNEVRKEQDSFAELIARETGMSQAECDATSDATAGAGDERAASIEISHRNCGSYSQPRTL